MLVRLLHRWKGFVLGVPSIVVNRLALLLFLLALDEHLLQVADVRIDLVLLLIMLVNFGLRRW